MIGLYCQNSTKQCKKQKQQRQSCESDYECVNSHVCANKECIRYGGIFNGQESSNPLAC